VEASLAEQELYMVIVTEIDEQRRAFARTETLQRTDRPIASTRKLKVDVLVNVAFAESVVDAIRDAVEPVGSLAPGDDTAIQVLTSA
jgi:hypothetical protein